MHVRMIKTNLKIFYGKHAPQARFLVKQNAPKARFFEQVLMVGLSYWYSMYLEFIFHKSQLRIFFFWLIN